MPLTNTIDSLSKTETMGGTSIAIIGLSVAFTIAFAFAYFYYRLNKKDDIRHRNQPVKRIGDHK